MKREYDFSKGERGKFYRQNARLNLPRPTDLSDWAGLEKSSLCNFIVQESEKTLQSYGAQPNLVTEHANHEHDTARGGYAHRQIFELVQNSADALINAPNREETSILVRLNEDYLYCADNGRPIDKSGVRALMFSHLSSKRNTSEIGRFGLGFKSVLGVTDAPEFYSRPGSFRFDREEAADRIARVAQPEPYPVLRLPIPVDPHDASKADQDLQELMTWAANIVRLPLKPGARKDLAQQVEDFPPEFLLFVEHVRYLTLEHKGRSREFVLQRSGKDELRLDTGEGSSRWKCFKTTHKLSVKAQKDWDLPHGSGNVPIWWAAPLDRVNDSGHYWHFFPTQTASLLAGILNAPWKVNEDRQNLLPGPYNDELIDAAAKLVAKHLPKLATKRDPAVHLDALPRDRRPGDIEYSERLRTKLDTLLGNSRVVPDRDGCLRKIEELSYAPQELTGDQRIEKPLKKWEGFGLRPKNWLHHSALTRERIAKIRRLFPQLNQASIWEWLEALVEGHEGDEEIMASRAALQVAAAIPEEKGRDEVRLANILLTQTGKLCAPKPDTVFLPAADEDQGIDDQLDLVHTALASDAETAGALKVLGIEQISAESRFRYLVKKLLATKGSDKALWTAFWRVSREAGADKAHTIVGELIDRHTYWTRLIYACTRSGDWQPLHSVLLPGAIVSNEGDRDGDVTVDTEFHGADLELLERLGATAVPKEAQELSAEPFFSRFLSQYRHKFRERKDLPSKPNFDPLRFHSTVGSGPLEVLKRLSDEGKARYTDALLSLEATYVEWTMSHDNPRLLYSDLEVESPTVALLREHGHVQCNGEFVPIREALDPRPANQAALSVLLSHPMADRIREAFGLQEPRVEPVGEEDPIPLTDVWPGLAGHLTAHSETLILIRCQQLAAGADTIGVESARVDTNIYLVGTGDEDYDLRLVVRKLGLNLSDKQIAAILHYVTPQKIEARRRAIRDLETDAERLLKAVGAGPLRSGLPPSLLAVLESGRARLTGVELAEAAIATYHTAALYEYSGDLSDLDPPGRWTGSPTAVAFVQSLGFSPEWAGQGKSNPPPFLEVEGPYSLPDLHEYQRRIVAKVRGMLGNGHGGRRGMISLPTGSGKTRIAVQAVVEAMCNGFSGGVLWVADRGELCEQAVEAWRQVWSNAGADGKRLRVSRMWARPDRPLPTSDLHVIVATIQTLKSRLSNRPDEYRFLADFNLVVFDEAHRSVAPSYTAVMQEIGLTRWQREKEPFLLGLTATPYRGHDEKETARLANRYGHNRLDAGAFTSDEPSEVIRELQEMRVLAHADHETIKGGDFSLNPDELRELEAMPHPAWLPQNVENRIALDANRTRRIVDAYKNFVGDEKWPTLIFATSVEHAKTVAALLNVEGVVSRAVSGGTETSVRRDIVERFRAGEIDVLVNYGVFREGFDAPRTRVIIVARPVYSPNLYFQMIGRGLRGPKNGGNERCLIVNVRDNILNFDRALAFSELDWLWG